MTARRRRCAGAAHATIYPYGPFPVGGGATIMLGLQNEREWRVFCAQVLRQAELAEDPRFLSNSQRTANREALRTLIVDAFAGLDIDQVTQRLEDAQIANARVNDMAGVWAHPQLQARQRWRGLAARPARCRRCCRPPPTTPTRRAWIPCRPWAKTPTRC